MRHGDLKLLPQSHTAMSLEMGIKTLCSASKSLGI